MVKAWGFLSKKEEAGSQKKESISSVVLGGFPSETPWSFASALGSIRKEIASDAATFTCFVYMLSGEQSINKWLPGGVCATPSRKQIEM